MSRVREDALLQVHEVDRRPHLPGERGGLLVRVAGEHAEERRVVAGGLGDEPAEPLHVPLLDVGGGGVEVDGEVDVVVGKGQSLEDEHRGLLDHLGGAVDDVVRRVE